MLRNPTAYESAGQALNVLVSGRISQFADGKPRIRTHQTARQILAKSRLEVVLRQQSR